MSELETMIRGSAGPDEWVADWDEVLRRAGHSRFRPRRVAVLTAVAAVVAILLLPGIGIGGGLGALLSGSSPGFEIRAELERGGRAVGTVTVTTSRLFVAIDPKTGRVRSAAPRPFRIPRPEFRWSMQLMGATAVTSARIVQRGRVVARLCSPCSDGAHGTFRTTRLGLQTVFGKGTVVADTPSGPARGTLKLQPPQR